MVTFILACHALSYDIILLIYGIILLMYGIFLVIYDISYYIKTVVSVFHFWVRII